LKNVKLAELLKILVFLSSTLKSNGVQRSSRLEIYKTVALSVLL
jgi:hypothetical protein